MIRLHAKIGNFEFTSSITGMLITLMLIALFVKLGFWQLSRMSEKKVLAQHFKERTLADVIEFTDEEGAMIARDFNSFRFFPMSLTGTFLKGQDILLDNQIDEGRAGYHVITPFLSQASNTLILIDRGWIPWGGDRSELPKIPVVNGLVTLKGNINKFQTGIQLKPTDEGQGLWPLRVQLIDYDVLSAALQKPVFHFILKLEKGSPFGFEIHPIYFGISSERHLGYAVQWFTMSLATLIYYLVINLRRRKL